MLPPLAHHRVLRYAGIGTWAALGAPLVVWLLYNTRYFGEPRIVVGLLCFTLFGPAFWFSSRLEGQLPQWARVAAFAVETLVGLVSVFIFPSELMGFLLVIVSWQLALSFSMRTAIIWAAIQTVLLLLAYEPAKNFPWGWAAGWKYVGFQAFAMVTAFVARSEADSRRDLARTNAELEATRELLTESTRLAERARISRDLHDILGHNLTALSLHLEVACHKTEGEAQRYVRQAQAVSKAMLADVRDVVSRFRDLGTLDVRRALDALCEGLPQIQVHLRYPEGLHIEDSARAQILVRCVQEIITNAMKHSEAENLWIEIAGRDDSLEISAHDDGKGAQLPEAGLGLSGMRARLEEAGGRLSFESQPKAGFRVSASLPLARQGAS
jgi:signal transduction histidine kinase